MMFVLASPVSERSPRTRRSTRGVFDVGSTNV